VQQPAAQMSPEHSHERNCGANCRDAVATIGDHVGQDIRVHRCHTLKRTMTKALQSPPGHATLLKEIKERVRTAQVRAAVAVNLELPAVLVDWPEHSGPATG